MKRILFLFLLSGILFFTASPPTYAATCGAGTYSPAGTCQSSCSSGKRNAEEFNSECTGAGLSLCCVGQNQFKDCAGAGGTCRPNCDNASRGEVGLDGKTSCNNSVISGNVSCCVKKKAPANKVTSTCLEMGQPKASEWCKETYGTEAYCTENPNEANTDEGCFKPKPTPTAKPLTSSTSTAGTTPTGKPLASPCNAWSEIDDKGKVTKENAIKWKAGDPYPTLPAGKKFKCATVDTAIGSIQTDPVLLVKQLFGILLSLAGGIALLLIIYSGYQIMVSQGNPEKLQQARETLTSAIVGLVFLIFSLVILQIIGVDILRIPGWK